MKILKFSWFNFSGGFRQVLPFAFLFLSIAALRWGQVIHFGANSRTAIELGLPIGLYYDLVACLLPLVFGLISRSVLGTFFWGWILSALLLWIAPFANLLYFQFFHRQLEWWVVLNHVQDLVAVRGFATSLAMSVPVSVSFLLLLASFWSAFRAPWSRKMSLSAKGTSMKYLSSGVGVFILFLVSRQVITTFALSRYFAGTTFSNFVIYNWYIELSKLRGAAGRAGQALNSEEMRDNQIAASVLAHYRDLGKFQNKWEVSPSHSQWPLYTASKTRAHDSEWQTRLGFGDTQNLNVLVIFVESLRTYELGHPKLGPLVFPRLSEVLREKAVYYTQAYSSGQITVQGEFSTLCSFLPSFEGRAVYLARPNFDGLCIQGLLRERGYKTLYANTYHKHFDNTYVFEVPHGTGLFFDHEYFYQQGIRERVGDWGLADKPFLKHGLKLLEGFHSKAEHFFANFLTMSTHGPWSESAQARLPKGLDNLTRGQSNYRLYLAALHYTDEALGDFFDEFFKRPISDNTLVILLGDHSVPILPHTDLTGVQTNELRFRIPLALISKHLRQGKTISHPVHQVDVAPTIAELLDVTASTTWVGKSLSSKTGSPWVQRDAAGISYRTKNLGCYSQVGSKRPVCYKLENGADPLFDHPLPMVPERADQTSFFRRVIEANKKIISYNRLRPAESKP